MILKTSRMRLLVYFLSTAVFGCLKSDDIVYTPGSPVNVGSSVILECPFATSRDTSCSWSHRNIFVRQHMRGVRFGMYNDRLYAHFGSSPLDSEPELSRCRLRIEQVNIDDEGPWVCIVDDLQRSIVDLTVAADPVLKMKYNGLDLSDSKDPLIIKSNITQIECISFGGPPAPKTIIWNISGKEIVQDAEVTFSLYHLLTVRSAINLERSPDPIDVTCSLIRNNKTEQTVTKKIITEHHTTLVKIVHPGFDPYVGDTQPTIILLCEGNGYPTPTTFRFFWVNSVDEIQSDGAQEIGRGTNVAVGRPGIYYCDDVISHVRSEEIQIFKTSANNITVHRGSAITLPCAQREEGYMLCFWISSTTIVHNDETNVNLPYHITPRSNNCNLTIRAVDISDQGLWQCFAEDVHRTTVYWLNVIGTTDL